MGQWRFTIGKSRFKWGQAKKNTNSEAQVQRQKARAMGGMFGAHGPSDDKIAGPEKHRQGEQKIGEMVKTPVFVLFHALYSDRLMWLDLLISDHEGVKGKRQSLDPSEGRSSMNIKSGRVLLGVDWGDWSARFLSEFIMIIHRLVG